MAHSSTFGTAKRWAFILVGWTALGFFTASQIYIRYAYYSDHPPSWRSALIVAFTDWYAWAALSPFILWIARRLPIEPRMKKLHMLLHLLAALLLSALKTIIELQSFHFFMGVARPFTVPQLQSNLIVYVAIMGIFFAFAYYTKYRTHELRASQLETRLAQAQLQALKMQLHPHFLFNTLHAISTLIHRDPEAADRMLARLSELLRLTLENAGVQEVPLQQELDFLERYLTIEQIRFQDRLTVEMQIDPATLDLLVPNFILQPLVENAVRHGLAPRAAPGRIEILAQRENGRLHLQVRDDGPGLTTVQINSNQTGVGLANTRTRLQQLYGSAHGFDLQNGPAGGLEVNLFIPLKQARQKDAGIVA